MRWWLTLGLVCSTGCAALAGLDDEYAVGGTGAAGESTTTATGSGSGTTSTGGTAGTAGTAGTGGTGGTGAGGGGGTAGSGGAPGPVCGNDIHEPPGEECDDGNTTSLDGCSATCTIEDPDSCTAAPVIVLALGQTEVVTGDTTGANDDVTNSTTTTECGTATWPGSDHVWAVVPQVSGTLDVVLNASFDSHYLHLRDACPGTTDLGCDWATSPSDVDDFTVPVQGGTKYYATVDSWASTAGTYTLTVTLN